MINVFGEENLKPVRKHGLIIPEYFVTKTAKVYSNKSKRFLTDCAANKNSIYRKISLNIPIGHFGEDSYPYYEDNSICYRQSFDLHRVVMEAWRPIDDYPPESLKSTWGDVPETWRQWVRDTALIDHIDGNPKNNHLYNLRWVTPKENNHWRKEHESSKFS